MKHEFNFICGAIGGFISAAFGGWTATMTTLLIFMAIDYLTGILVAAVFKKSGKSKNGSLDSSVGWKGLIKKCVTLLVILIGYRLDLILQVEYIRDALVIAFCVNELISIVENLGLMGIPIPAVLRKAIDILNTKEEDLEDNGSNN